MKPRSLNFITGFSFIPAWSALGIVAILLALPSLVLDQEWEMGGFVLLGVAMLMNFDGVKFNFEKGWVQSYTLIFGVFRLGKKEPISKFPYLAILRMTYRRFSLFRGLRPSVRITDSGSIGSRYEQYEVHLLSKNRRGKIMIQNCQSREKAQALAEKIAALASLEIVEYNPKRSLPKR